MCDIAGFVCRDEHRDLREARTVLESRCRVIDHCGPDDQGTLVKNQVALGMRRTSIIDLAGGHQPISGCDGAFTIVFNGEISHYRDLQRELESRGHRVRTSSDTEAIVHAYEEFGSSCVDHFPLGALPTERLAEDRCAYVETEARGCANALAERGLI
jgi:asparagine synthase (glutamine-hydrolysing)